MKKVKENTLPDIEDYATVEAYCDGVPVYAFGYTYILGVSPTLLPGVVLQQENPHPSVKIKPKKSWEIKHNLCGSTPAREPKTMWNDDQPLLPVHLIDGDPETAWASRGATATDTQPEWIRVDLPVEAEVGSVALVCSESGPGARSRLGPGLKPGKSLPRELTIKLSQDGREWSTVHHSSKFAGPDSGPTVVKFPPRRAKQVWIIGADLQPVLNWGPSFSIGEVEVRSPDGENMSLISRGAGVTVSSTYYGYGMDRFTQDMLWPIQYDLGFKWSRVGYDMGMFLWSYVERERGNLRIDPKADAAITQAWQNGVNVIMCLDKGNWLYHLNPRKTDWRRSRIYEMMETYYDHQGWPHESEEMMEGWLRYVRYMVKHFSGRVALFEICNEWQGIGVDNYIAIAEATIPVIREADPGAKIMLGSTGGFDRSSILACLRAGLGSSLDAIGWHPFYQADPDEPGFRNYRQDVVRFMEECEELGFRGSYAATEWTWSSPYPGTTEWCSEIQKAKYSVRLMTAHCGLNIISLYNETFQTGRIDWDVTLLRNAFQSDPISPAQPQPTYYVLRTLSTVLDGFQPSEIPLELEGADDCELYTFRRGESEVLMAIWSPGRAKDRDVGSRVDLKMRGLRARRAWAIDIMNGTRQRLVLSNRGEDTMVESLVIHDFPVFIRIECSRQARQAECT